jgi:hypothetical protein
MPKGKKEFRVGDQYRTNPLSKVGGGSTLLVEESGYIKAYTNIKNVQAYAYKLIEAPSVTRIWEKGINGNYDILIYSS